MPHEWLNLVDVRDVTGDLAQGGYAASLVFYNTQADVVNHRTLTLRNRVFSGSSWEAQSRIALIGLIIPQSVTVTRGISQVAGSLYTYHQQLQEIPVTGCYFVDSAAGAHAHQINNLSLALVVQHLAEEHVTVNGETGGIDTSLVETANSTTVDPYIVRENTSLWQALKKIASDEFYSIYFNRNNQLVYEPHPQFDATVPDEVAILDNSDILQPYAVQVRTGRKVRNVVMLGLTNAGQVLESTYPAGAGVDVRGPKFEVRCNTQARLDTLAQRQYEWLTRDYTAEVTLPNAWPFELNDHVKLTLAGTATNGATFSWSEKSFWVSRVAYRKQQLFGYLTTLTLEEGYVS